MSEVSASVQTLLRFGTFVLWGGKRAVLGGETVPAASKPFPWNPTIVHPRSSGKIPPREFVFWIHPSGHKHSISLGCGEAQSTPVLQIPREKKTVMVGTARQWKKKCVS